ncbi:hypothetical protein CDD83_1161 [Cordyceps sp. RAO-2017]|nr:hypothetical protein CDD83_1161 [Cordyceps sp. RAO-2017]
MQASRAACCWRCSLRLSSVAQKPAPARTRVLVARYASSAASPSLEASSSSSAVDARALDARPARRRSPARGLPRPQAADAAVAIFNEVVSQSGEAGDVAAGRQKHSVEWELVAKLTELEGRPVDDPAKLDLFQTDVWPELKKMRGQFPQNLYWSVTQFLGKTCRAAVQQGHVGVSLRLSKMYARLNRYELDTRGLLVLSLCHTIISGQLAPAQRGAVVRELIEMWKHISQLRRPSQKRRNTNQFALPSADEVLSIVESATEGPTNYSSLVKALAGLFNQYRLLQAVPLVPALLASVAVLTDPELTGPSQQIEAAPLLILVAAVLLPEMPDSALVGEALAGRTASFPPSHQSDVRAYVLGRWPQASDALQSADAPWRNAPTALGRHGGLESLGLVGFHQELRDAYVRRDAGRAVSAWRRLKAFLDRDPATGRLLRQDADFLHFCDFCVFLWCALRQPDSLQETLELMDQLELEPTVKTYTAMLHGWKTCKDSGKMTALWDRLVQSGTKLDVHIWTERISGLMEANRPQSGVQALAEMMELWKRAVKEHGADAAADAAVQPNIEVVNAAVTGLHPAQHQHL